MNYYLDVLKKYAEFDGRATRTEFWMFVLFNLIISLLLMFIDGMTGLNILQAIYSLAVLIPGLAVSVRRLHDIGKSGWMILVALIPLIGLVWLLVLYCMDSTPGKNKYGSNPKEGPADESAPISGDNNYL